MAGPLDTDIEAAVAHGPRDAPPLSSDLEAGGSSPDLGKQSFLDRAWGTIQGIGANLQRNYQTAGQPALQDQGGEVAPVHAPFMAGVARGMQDVTDTAHRGITYAIGGDLGPIRQRQQQSNDQFDQEYGDSLAASGGRVLGQTLATAPIGGAIGNVATKAIPWLATPAASVLGRTGQLATEGAIQGGATAGMTGQDPLTGAAAGALLGPAVTGATAALGYPIRAITGNLPNQVDPDIAAWAQKAQQQYGIDIDPSKLMTNPTYKIAMDQLGKLPLSGVSETTQRQQWQNAVAQQFGESAPKGITYDVMDRAATRIGQTFDGIANRTTIQGGAPLNNDLISIASEMPQYGLTDAQKKPIQAQFQNVLQAFGNTGTITGKAYQNLTQRGGPLDSVINSQDPTVSAFGMKIKSALDDAFQRSASPADQAALTEARMQYRNMKTVQPLVEQRGATGDLNPNALKQRVIAQSQKYDPSTGGFAYTGGGPMGDLANIGSIFYSPQPESGTAARSAILGALGGGHVVGALAAPTTAGLSAAGITGGLLANRAAQAYLRNPEIGARMVANTLNPQPYVTQMPRYGVSGAVGLLNAGNQ
jgi:hypothetical protein